MKNSQTQSIKTSEISQIKFKKVVFQKTLKDQGFKGQWHRENHRNTASNKITKDQSLFMRSE